MSTFTFLVHPDDYERVEALLKSIGFKFGTPREPKPEPPTIDRLDVKRIVKAWNGSTYEHDERRDDKPTDVTGYYARKGRIV